MFTVVDRSADIRLIDRGINNRFSWKWLEDKDFNNDFLSDYIRKIDQPGYCICEWCSVSDRIKYANSGKKDLKQHSKSKKHKQVRNERHTIPALPAVFLATSRIPM
jgi:hypothetical protein